MHIPLLAFSKQTDVLSSSQDGSDGKPGHSVEVTLIFNCPSMAFPHPFSRFLDSSSTAGKEVSLSGGESQVAGFLHFPSRSWRPEPGHCRIISVWKRAPSQTRPSRLSVKDTEMK